MKAIDIFGNEVELHGDSPLKRRLTDPKPFGSIKAKPRTGSTHPRRNRFYGRPNPPRWDRRK